MTPEPESRRYTMRIDEGRRKYGFRGASESITLNDEGFAWTSRERPKRRGYGDVRAVRLQCVLQGRPAPLAICQIDFADGLILRLRNIAGLGWVSGQRSGDYRRFVVDLHEQLRARGHVTVTFHGGNTQGRQTIAVAAFVLLMILLVGLPVVFAVATGNLVTLAVAAIGLIAAGLPLGHMIFNNRPVTYTPDDIPARLVP